MSVSKVVLRFCRCYSSGSRVRVRFAPSPTGLLHLGGLRTALYNFLFAHSKKGVFILRIEDTDQSRLVPGATQQLIDDLEWAGVHPDEGPTSGGDHGPYFQSERIHIYREEVEKLIKRNAAYYCFCTENRLELLRKDALRNRKVPKYDNHCRHLSSDEVKAKLASGLSKCVRFKLVPSEPYTDIVYGRINHDVHDIEGDPIILKTDGWPTYHLANVVDDHMMDISHVIRGVEWMPSTNKHLMIYKAFGYEPPMFGHIPLLLNSDGTKFSKRQGDLSIKALRQEGILPRALVNFVLQAGSGFDAQVNNTSSMEDLISSFQIDKISTNSCRLPFTKLPDFNRSELARRVSDPNYLKQLVTEVQTLVADKFGETNDADVVVPDETYVSTVLHWCLPRITKLSDLVSDNLKFLWVMPKASSLSDIDPGLLEALEMKLEKSSFDQKSLVSSMKSLASEQQISYKNLMHILRKVLSGLETGPGVAEMMMVFRKDLSLERIRRAKMLIAPTENPQKARE
ncbi:hypothetical protein GE061_018316 [Apolygus lucorum]|uniref:Nondiscriminating glutamyl-tRNA synthetase EARS2, mitochondrial n=1 Tax=Apolygus lucorum TaxID=248454 RepID=A0A6A4IY53_APOLU|nr:hypothetical protein GE061_018316 [Apolygus lucorum]